jgi:hypothetical protein
VWIAAACAGGCAAAPQTRTPLDPDDTREIAVPRDEAFRAAAGTLLDQGCVFTISDWAAGLVGGTRWHEGPGYQGLTTVVWVRDAGQGRSVVRVHAGARRGSTAEFVDRMAQRALVSESHPGTSP